MNGVITKVAFGVVLPAAGELNVPGGRTLAEFLAADADALEATYPYEIIKFGSSTAGRKQALVLKKSHVVSPDGGPVQFFTLMQCISGRDVANFSAFCAELGVAEPEWMAVSLGF